MRIFTNLAGMAPEENLAGVLSRMASMGAEDKELLWTERWVKVFLKWCERGAVEGTRESGVKWLKELRMEVGGRDGEPGSDAWRYEQQKAQGLRLKGARNYDE